jgi:predicted nucleotidyltransferase
MDRKPMLEHHAKTIQKLTTCFQNDSGFLALLIGGSVARGWAIADSDVDIMLVATDKEYAQREASGDLGIFDHVMADYPRGMVEGKIIDLTFLRDVADHGSEPARFAFRDTIVAFSHLPELTSLLARIPMYPEHRHGEKMRAFASQFAIYKWYQWDSERRQNTYLCNWATNHVILFGGRLILAHNRILYPYHKWFLHQLRLAPQKPEGLMQQIDILLKRPDSGQVSVFYEMVTNFLSLDIDMDQAAVNFVHQTEWNWRDGTPPLVDW